MNTLSLDGQVVSLRDAPPGHGLMITGALEWGCRCGAGVSQHPSGAMICARQGHVLGESA